MTNRDRFNARDLCFSSFCNLGQIDSECGTTPGFAFNRDPAAVLQHDTVNDGKAEARALPLLLRSKEGVEYPVNGLRRYSYT